MCPIGPRHRTRSTPKPSTVVLTGNRLRLGLYQNIWANNAPFGLAGSVNSSEEFLSTPVSEHPAIIENTWDETHPGPPFNSGGPFTSLKVEMPSFEMKGVNTYREENMVNSTDRFGRYIGGFAMPDFTRDDLSIQDYLDMGSDLNDLSLFPSMDTLGAEAYNKLRPQIEIAQIGVALAETRDLPRMLQTTSRGFHDIWRNMGGNVRSSVMQPKKVADHFLNTQFGWVPFLGDLSKLLKLEANFAKYVANAIRKNDVWLRRVRTDPVIESETVIEATPTGFGCQPGNDFNMARLYHTGADSHTAKLITRETVLNWYEGRFKYYRPEFDRATQWDNPILDTVRRMSTLSGVRITPSVIWKATPWTWLIDWVTNSGDAVQRVTDRAYDGIVSKYMYCMQSRIRSTILQQKLSTQSFNDITLEWNRKVSIKRRAAADSSYGFRLASSPLNNGQLAILGALGLSRFR
jgi:hypothetical protein